MKTTRSKAEAALEDEITAAFKRFGTNIQFRMLDLPKIMRDAKLEHSAGVPLDEAMPAIIERYRVKS